MKTNTTKKVIVATMAIAMGASIVGSISGTAAWYQYSTRATVEYQGAAAKATEDLLLSTSQTGTYANSIKLGDGTLTPVTAWDLALNKAPATLYKNPYYQIEDPTKWGTAEKDKDFVQFEIWAKVHDLDGTDAADPDAKFFEGKKIYLTDVTIQAAASAGQYDASEHTDVSDAVRVAIWPGNVETLTDDNGWGTYSIKDYSTTGLKTHGKLDLGGPANEGLDKTTKYSFETGGEEVDYGKTNAVQDAKSYSYPTTPLATDDSTHKIADDSDPAHIKGAALATTGTNGAAVKVCTVRIYLEGWEPLGAENAKSSLWDLGKTIGAKFNVGLRFSTTPVGDETNGQQQPSTNP